MPSIRQAVILAGGRGERLRPLTDDRPKPMILIHERPFLEYLLEMLQGQGITNILLLLGYLPEKIIDHFGDGSRFGLTIEYSVSDVSDDTGTRIKKAQHLLDDDFLLMYCDNYWPLNLKKLLTFYEQQNTDASVVVYSNKDATTKNNIFVGESGHVMKYDKTRSDSNLNGVEIGFFLLNKAVKDLLPDGDFNFEKEILPRLIDSRQLSGYRTSHRYYSASTPERLPLTEDFFRKRKVMFIDRDGVINKKAPKADYIKKWDEFEFLPGAIEGLHLLRERGYEVYIATNQPGIARGMMTHMDLEQIHVNMEEEFKKNGFEVQGIYSCLHGWDDGCDCRKPKPGLLYWAANEHHFDITKSIFIGDDTRDIEAGEAAGCKTILLEPGENLLMIIKLLDATL